MSSPQASSSVASLALLWDKLRVRTPTLCPLPPLHKRLISPFQMQGLSLWFQNAVADRRALHCLPCTSRGECDRPAVSWKCKVDVDANHSRFIFRGILPLCEKCTAVSDVRSIVEVAANYSEQKVPGELLKHLLWVNGHDENRVERAQQCVSLAYAVHCMLRHLPFSRLVSPGVGAENVTSIREAKRGKKSATKQRHRFTEVCKTDDLVALSDSLTHASSPSNENVLIPDSRDATASTDSSLTASTSNVTKIVASEAKRTKRKKKRKRSQKD